MTFRRRLRLFFVTIVIIPMAGVALGVLAFTGRSETAGRDAVIAEGMRVALALHEDQRERAERALRRVVRDDRLVAALVRDRPRIARARMVKLARQRGLRSMEFRPGAGGRAVSVRRCEAFAGAKAPLRLESGRQLGVLSVSVTCAGRHVERVAELTDFEVAVFRRRRLLASTAEHLRRLPADASGSTAFELGGRDYRGRLARIREADGTPIDLLVFRTAASLADDADGPRVGMGIVLLATMLLALGLSAAVVRENVRLHERLQERVVTDPLTTLGNRHAFEAALSREVERRWRHGTPFSLMYLDIDGFKGVNDRFGHPHGDAVLSSVATALRSASRDIDEPFRVGGDEFTVVLPQTEVDGAAEVAERMREAVEALSIRPEGSDRDLRLTASFGVASIENGASLDRSQLGRSLIDAANGALRRAKQKGRNRVETARVGAPTGRPRATSRAE